MDLSKLKERMPYQWRIQSWNKEKKSAACVAYIDARDVANMLDSVCGPENWQDEYKTVGSLLFAGIGIKVGADWIWKWDTGSESNIEKEKGHVSDSFKRAGVKWGIGRFLYDLPVQRVKGDGSGKVFDESGKQVWDLTEYINNRTSPRGKRPVAPQVKQEPAKLYEPFKDEGTPLPDNVRKALMAEYGSADRKARLEDANAILQRLKPGCKVITSFSELTPLSGNALLNEVKKLKGAA